MTPNASASDNAPAGTVANATARAAEQTPAQAEAGNYRKGHIRLHGLDISIENALGTIRAGVGADGQPWTVVMPAPYGDVKGTQGAEGDPIDVYLCDRASEPRLSVYVIDQIDPGTGRFDEHKAVLGAASREEALAIYDGGFSDPSGPRRRAAATELPIEAFRLGSRAVT